MITRSASDTCRVLFGADCLENHAVVTDNGNPPLIWGETMIGAMRALCHAKQPVLCSPFVLDDAITPATVAAPMAQLSRDIIVVAVPDVELGGIIRATLSF